MTKNLRCLLAGILLIACGLINPLLAQNTITTQALSIASICAGSTFDVPFTISGSYTNGNAFTVQLSDGGNYTNIPTSGPSYNSATGRYTVTATIPVTTPAGTTYKVRVNASNPAVIGSPSSTVLTVKIKPEVPLVQAPQSICQARTGMQQIQAIPINVTATAGSGATASLYFESGSPAGGGYNPNTTNGNVTTFNLTRKEFDYSETPKFPVAETNFYAAQTVNGCQSDLVKTTVKTLWWPVSGPTPANQYAQDYGRLTYCQGEKAQPLNVNGHGAPIENYRIIYKGPEPYPVYKSDDVFTRDAPTPPTSTTGQTYYTFRYEAIDPTKSCSPVLSFAFSHYPGESYSQIVINAKPSKPITSSALTYCQNQTANLLTAYSSDASASVVWYGTDATGGTGSPNAPRPSTTTAGTFKYYVALRQNDCEGDRAEITVEVKAAAPAPTTTALSYCVGAQASQLSAVAASGGALTWYTASSGGTGTAAAPTPNTNNPGGQTYYVAQTVGASCESTRTPLLVTINGLPAAPVMSTANTTFCQNSTGAPLVASGQNIKWYDVASGGTGNSNTFYPATAVVGTKNYYASQTVNNCEGPRSSLSVTILEAPVAPTVSQISYEFCQGTTGSISATVLPGATISWNAIGSSPGIVNPSRNGNIASATVVTDQARTMAYSLSQQIATGCSSPASVSINVTVKAAPSAPTVQAGVFCVGQASPTLQATGEKLLWYDAATGGTGSSVIPVVNTGQTNQKTYYVTQTVNGCESGRATLSVTVNPIPDNPSVGSALAYCQNAPAVALEAKGESVKWYTDATGGSGSGSLTPKTDTPGNFTYYATQTVKNCESGRTSLAVKINASPLAPVTTSALSYCQKAPADLLKADGTNLRWYTGGSSSAIAPVLSTDTPGMVSYYVTQTVENCESAKAEIKVTIKATPGAPGTSAISVCQNTSAPTLSANGSSLKWYAAAAGGDGSNTPPIITTGQALQTTYYVSQSIDNCEGPRASLSVTVKPTPSAPVGTSPTSYCQFAKGEAVAASGQNLVWYNADDSPFGNGSQAPVVTTDVGRTFTYKVTQTVDGCASPKATISVVIQTTPIPTVAKAIVELCQGGASEALKADGLNLKWTDPTGAVSTSAPVPTTLNATKNPDGDAFYVTQTGSNGCESTRATIKVFVQTVPTMSLAGATAVNLGIEVPIRLSFTGVGPYSYTLSNGLMGNATKDTTVLVLPTRTTTYQIAQVKNKCGTGLPGNGATVTITVMVPGIQTLALTSSTLCVGTQLTANFQTTGAFNSGSIFKLQLAKVETDTTKIVYTDVLNGSGSGGQLSGTIPMTAVGGQYFVRVVATNPKIPINGTNSPTLLTIRSGATATLTGTQSIYETQTAKLSIAFTGEAPWTVTYQDSSYATGAKGPVQTIQTAANPYTFDVKPDKTTAYLLTSVSNICGIGTRIATSAVITVGQLLAVKEPFSVEVFPVPATTSVTVHMKGLSAQKPAFLTLTDVNGRLLQEQRMEQDTWEMPLGQHPAGAYILRIDLGDQVVFKRILKL